LSKRSPEHPVHKTVQNKIDGPINERQYVHQFSVQLITL
jgi:hypothetical protein